MASGGREGKEWQSNIGSFYSASKESNYRCSHFFDLMVVSLNSHSQEQINAISPKDLKMKTKLSPGDGIRNHHIPCICSHDKCLKIK